MLDIIKISNMFFFVFFLFLEGAEGGGGGGGCVGVGALPLLLFKETIMTS